MTDPVKCPICGAKMDTKAGTHGDMATCPECGLTGLVCLREKDGEVISIPMDPAEAVADHRSFPEAADGRPMPPMGDDLMTAGLSHEDARFVALQLAQNGLTIQPTAKLQAEAVAGATLQDRVWPWMLACFGEEVSKDREERGDRLLEEVFELLQSGGYDPARVMALRDYVWSREVGEPAQEVGGVMITLAAYCLANGLDMHEAGETELARIWTKVEKIRAKQAAKPKGSALPQAWPPADATAALARIKAEARKDALREAARKATSFLVGDPENGIPLRNPMAHEIETAILALIDKESAHE